MTQVSNLEQLHNEARRLDDEDPLRSLRSQFFLPEVYLCGHSLGAMPVAARQYVLEELEQWQRHAVEGHFNGSRPWMSYHEQLAPGLAVLTGAQAGEVVAMNSLTVNLHLLLVSFYRPTRERWKMLLEAGAFPSDRYALASHARLHGFDPAETLIEIKPRAGEDMLRTEDIEGVLAAEGASIATVLLPGVQYLTGQVLDVRRLTAAARAQGCSVGIDLAHAIGNVPLRLHDWDVDFAVWCSYKYLNAGPGAIGGAFVHARHAQRSDLPRFAGWWGHDKDTRFAMPEIFQALPGAEGWQLSNPPILAMAPLLASLQVFEAAGPQRRLDKARRLTAFLRQALAPLADPANAAGLTIITPPVTPPVTPPGDTDEIPAGAQLSLRLRGGAHPRDVYEQLKARGILVDWREPDILRVAPVALYNSFDDVWRFAAELQSIFSSTLRPNSQQPSATREG